jgi:lipopolysaccharide transport system permease protein
MKSTTLLKPPAIRIIERQTGWRSLDLRELIRYRDLFYFLVARDVKVLYKQTILGFGWAILRPFFSMIVFSIVFGRLAKMPSDGIPYPLFSYVALVPWTYFQTALNMSTNSMITNSRIISKVYFPRVLIPLAPVVSGMVDFLIAMSIVVLMMIYYDVTPNVNLFFLPLLVVIMMLTAAATGLWLSVLGVQYRDVKFAIQFLIQILMYAAPVVWPATLIPDKYRIYYGLYPMAGVIEGFRSALLGKNPMPWDLIVVGMISAAFLFVTGLCYFRRAERILADVA